VQIYN